MNPRIRNLSSRLLSDNWYKLYQYTFDYLSQKGHWKNQSREAYDRGNGAAVLLYNPENASILLTRQFRLPTYVNGNPDGLMIEVCAGLLDGDEPEQCIRKEILEETGYRVNDIQKIMECYMSPGAVTEVLHFFTAQYSPAMKVSEGGGLEEENEDIEVIEVKLEEAMQMISRGEIRDGKTILLLQHASINRLC